jgi:hypothetical protein
MYMRWVKERRKNKTQINAELRGLFGNPSPVELAFEHRIGAILVGRHDELVPQAFEELAQPQFAGNAAEV